MNVAHLSIEHSRALVEMADKLTCHFDLCGINSLDCILCDERLYCLELNPRPATTMQLYEASAPGYLFDAHVKACSGVLEPVPFGNKEAREVCAHAVVYALDDRKIQPSELSQDASDIPPGTPIIAAGEPICSVNATGASMGDVLFRLQSKIRRIQRRHP